MRTAAKEALERIRAICLALPETTERPSHGAPTFFAGPKTFAMFMDHHHDDGRLAIWCAAPLGVQGDLVRADADRFFIPPYVGHRGWLGIRLDRPVDWDETASLIEDGYRMVATKRALAKLDAECAQTHVPGVHVPGAVARSGTDAALLRGAVRPPVKGVTGGPVAAITK